MRFGFRRVLSSQTITLLVLVVTLFVLQGVAGGATSVSPDGSQQAADWLRLFITQHGLGLGLLAVFVGGLALNLTPCVYPMIPVTLAFFTGQATDAGRRGPQAVGRVILLALCYVLGISLNYALLGIVAAKTGALFGSWLQHPLVLIGIATVVVALACSMFGLYELRIPRVLTQRLSRASAGAWGAFFMGVVVGIVAAPCIGPFVLSLLLVVGKLANPVIGFLLFFVLGLGMGLPYLFLGIAAHRIKQLPKAGAWMIWSKNALGLVLIGLALYVLRPLLPKSIVGLAMAALFLGAGLYLGWIERSRQQRRQFVWMRRSVGAILIVASLVIGWPAPKSRPSVAWIPYSAAALQEAQRAHLPVLIDLYADWCVPCVEMDHATFHHPTVMQALTTVRTLRIDVTRDVAPEAAQLIEQYHVYGVPTVLFIDRQGQERQELRMTGFATPHELLERLKRLSDLS